jgi:MarR-like DNA-binding transcriptional regulator SgrR of sgrS sRNA
MTASDVVYSLEQAAKSGSIYADRLSDVKTVRASGSNTVEITLDAANAAFETLLDIPIVCIDTGRNAIPDGTGPYQVQEKNGKAKKLVARKAVADRGGKAVRCRG